MVTITPHEAPFPLCHWSSFTFFIGIIDITPGLAGPVIITNITPLPPHIFHYVRNTYERHHIILLSITFSSFLPITTSHFASLVIIRHPPPPTITDHYIVIIIGHYQYYHYWFHWYTAITPRVTITPCHYLPPLYYLCHPSMSPTSPHYAFCSYAYRLLFTLFIIIILVIVVRATCQFFFFHFTFTISMIGRNVVTESLLPIRHHIRRSPPFTVITPTTPLNNGHR